jgi:hypothetical protein
VRARLAEPRRENLLLALLHRTWTLYREVFGGSPPEYARKSAKEFVRLGSAPNDYAAAVLRNDSTASSSVSYTSNTVSSFVTCSRSPTRRVNLASLTDPLALRALV